MVVVGTHRLGTHHPWGVSFGGYMIPAKAGFMNVQYNVVEVSGHNLESSQISETIETLGRGFGFLSGFPPFSFTVYSN